MNVMMETRRMVMAAHQIVRLRKAGNAKMTTERRAAAHQFVGIKLLQVMSNVTMVIQFQEMVAAQFAKSRRDGTASLKNQVVNQFVKRYVVTA